MINILPAPVSGRVFFYAKPQYLRCALVHFLYCVLHFLAIFMLRNLLMVRAHVLLVHFWKNFPGIFGSFYENAPLQYFLDLKTPDDHLMFFSYISEVKNLT